MDLPLIPTMLIHKYKIIDAIIANNVEEMRRLLSIKLDCMVDPYLDGEQISLAVEWKRKAILKMMMNHRHQFPLINDRSYKKIMHSAVIWGDIEVIDLIIRKFPQPKDVDEQIRTPLHLAIKNGRTDILCLFLCTIHTLKPPRFLKGVQQACTKLRTLDFQEFLNSNESINETVSMDSDVLPGWSLLHIAVVSQLGEMVIQLIDNGANISAKNKEGQTPVHLADRLNNSYLVRLMISALNRRRFFENTQDEQDGISFFHLSCKNGLNVSLIRNYFFNDDRERVHINEACNPTSAFPGYTALHFAILSGNENVVMLLINQKADVFMKSATQKTPLHLAYELGKEELIKVLLENLDRYNNITDVFGLSNYHIACAYSSTAVNKFIKAGHSHDYAIDNQAFDSAGYTPLHFAVENCNFNSVKLLLSQTLVNVNARTARNRIALHMSVKKKANGISKLLIIYGADPCILDYKRRSPLHLAYRKFQDEVAGFMLRNYKDFSNNPVDRKRMSHFHIACSYGDNEIVAKFLRHSKIDINRPSGYVRNSLTNAQSPLHFAVASGNIETIQLLIKHGAVVNAWNADGETPLLIAIGHPNPLAYKVVQLLLESGADPNMASSRRGETALHRVIMQKPACIKIFETLLAYKADVNLTCYKDIAALHLACMTRQPEFVRMLLNAGAEVDSLNAYGSMPIHMLTDASYKWNDFPTSADTELDDLDDEPWNNSSRMAKFFDIIDALLGAGLVSVDVRDISDVPTSTMACLHWNPACLQALLLHDSNMNTLADFWDKISDQNHRAVIIRMCLKMSIRRYNATHENYDREACDIFKSFDPQFNEISYTKACKEELHKIQMVRFNSRVVLSDVLLKDIDHVTMLSGNTELMEYVESDETVEKFPLYAYLLRVNLKKGLRRRRYLERVKKGLDKMVGGPLPDLVFRIINSFIRDDKKTYKNLLIAMDC